MADENSISRKAVNFVLDYEKNRGNEVVDVQTRGEFRGFDLFSFSNDKIDIRTIEVKGTQKDGIPDMFETEVTRNRKLIATHLYVVKFDEQKNPVKLFIIPALEIKPEDISETRHYRISSNFKTQRMKNFEVKLNKSIVL